jgi:hypothetical protein
MPGRCCVSGAHRSTGLVADAFEQYSVGAKLGCFSLEPVDDDVGLSLCRNGEWGECAPARGVEQRYFDIFVGRRMQVDLYLLALLTQVPECKLFAVGDDWQSIYRFAGSDIDLFTRFAHHFGVTATNYLTQTSL